MKILFILHYPPPIHGSAVVGGFIKKSKTINDKFDCRFINLGTSTSVEDIGRTSFGKYFRYLSLVWQVKKNLLVFRPHVCYITPTAAGPGFYKDAVIICLAKLFGIRTVFHYHNKGISVRQGRFIDNMLYRGVFKKSYIILLSNYLYSDIQKYVRKENVLFCPNGIPDVHGERRKENKESKKAVPELLFLSHLIVSKGVLELIEACTFLKEIGVVFHCTIAGGDAELTQHELENIVIEKQLVDRISLVGPRHGNDKLKLLTKADIFVHPTFNDCLPLVLLEAMQFSLPVVSTFEGAIPDVIEDNVTGFLVPQKDAHALADKLEVLIKNPDLRSEMGKAGRAKYEREFTLEKFENRMVEILQEVALK